MLRSRQGTGRSQGHELVPLSGLRNASPTGSEEAAWIPIGPQVLEGLEEADCRRAASLA